MTCQKSLKSSLTKMDISMDNIMDTKLYLEGLVLGLQDQASSHACKSRFRSMSMIFQIYEA